MKDSPDAIAANIRRLSMVADMYDTNCDDGDHGGCDISQTLREDIRELRQKLGDEQSNDPDQGQHPSVWRNPIKTLKRRFGRLGKTKTA